MEDEVLTNGNGSHDGEGQIGDHDDAFQPGQPMMLSTRQLARLMILRGLVQDTRAGIHGYAADGELAPAEEVAA